MGRRSKILRLLSPPSDATSMATYHLVGMSVKKFYLLFNHKHKPGIKKNTTPILTGAMFCGLRKQNELFGNEHLRWVYCKRRMAIIK